MFHHYDLFVVAYLKRLFIYCDWHMWKLWTFKVQNILRPKARKSRISNYYFLVIFCVCKVSKIKYVSSAAFIKRIVLKVSWLFDERGILLLSASKLCVKAFLWVHVWMRWMFWYFVSADVFRELSLEDFHFPCRKLYKVKNISLPVVTLWTQFCVEGSTDSWHETRRK